MDVDVKFPSPTPFLTRSPVVDSAPPPIPNARKRSKHAAAPGKKPTVKTHTVQDGVVAKPKQSKSRNGCITCKKKRLKCDELKPGCHQCQKRSVTCEGYKKDFKWRSFEEATFTAKPSSKVKKASACSPEVFKADLPHPLQQTSPSDHSNSTLNADDDFLNPAFDSGGLNLSDRNSALPQTPLYSSESPVASLTNPGSTFTIGSDLGYAPKFHDPYDHQLPNAMFTSMITPVPHSEVLNIGFTSPQSTQNRISNMDLYRQSNASKSRPAPSPLLYQSASRSTDIPVADSDFLEEYDEEILRDPSTQYMAASRTPSQNWYRPPVSPVPSDSSSSSEASNMAIYVEPSMSATSSEMLLSRFHQQTCGILSVKDGASENPWRTLIWPLAQDSPSLRHAIFSMSALHGSQESRELYVHGVENMQKSLEALVADMNNMHVDAALATTLALAFSDSWDEHDKTGIQHLRGSRPLLRKAIGNHKALVRHGGPDRQSAERVRFLCNTYIYMDVLARLTSLEETDNEVDNGYFENILKEVNGPLHAVSEVDPLLGCAYTLFPLIGRVANLVQKVRKTDSNSITLVSQAAELKQLVQQWVVPHALQFDRPEDPTSEVEHSIDTAEAYRWATLLYLQQAVPEVSSETAHVLAQRILKQLVRVPVSSRATIVQIFPLLAASCEMIDEEDRTCARDRWQAMIQRLQIRNVHKCLEVVEEVWRRRDVFESTKLEPAWRRQAARNGSATNGVAPSFIGSGKRKANTLEAMENESFFADYNGSGNARGSGDGPTVKRRVTMDHVGRPFPLSTMSMDMRQPSQTTFARRPSDMPLGMIEPEYTVRGGLHWLGVMRDNHWEVLLG